ncbi:MAG: DNA-formamidopyrimidine glycosylase family protein [Egibacteraceae bacterium]
MPEGHTIHRAARDHRRDLAGRAVAVSSPQGRFAAGAARLDGRVLVDVEAHGKHLFYRWAGGNGSGDDTLHVHLGLIGAFRSFCGPAPPPTAGTRLALHGGQVTVYLAGPLACELTDPDEEARLRARLGPDPLRRDADPTVAYAALQRRRIPIGAALLDQAVVAGVGNVFRAEALFVCGIDPARPANSLDRAAFDALWATLVAMLRKGVRQGRIATVGRDGRYVYQRAGEPCRRCGALVVGHTVAGRTLFSCPTCQRGT